MLKRSPEMGGMGGFDNFDTVFRYMMAQIYSQFTWGPRDETTDQIESGDDVAAMINKTSKELIESTPTGQKDQK